MLGKEIAKVLDLVYVEAGALLQKLIEKVANYQPPTDLEEGQQVLRERVRNWGSRRST